MKMNNLILYHVTLAPLVPSIIRKLVFLTASGCGLPPFAQRNLGLLLGRLMSLGSVGQIR